MASFQIPYSELSFQVARSGGPGGQNVNKTNSAVIVRFHVESSSVFSENQKARLLSKLSSKLTQSGELLIRSEEFRDQDRNKSACIEKLYQMLTAALFVPKKRIKTKPTKSSQRKRVEGKKKEGEIKALRKKISY